MGKVAKALRDAVALMNDSGAHWTRTTLVETTHEANGRDRYCSLGAIFEVTGVNMDRWRNPDSRESLPDWETIKKELEDEGDDETRREAICVLAKTIMPERSFDSGSFTKGNLMEVTITKWNDDTWRTWEQIVEMFERAAVAAETEEI